MRTLVFSLDVIFSERLIRADLSLRHTRPRACDIYRERLTKCFISFKIRRKQKRLLFWIIFQPVFILMQLQNIIFNIIFEGRSPQRQKCLGLSKLLQGHRKKEVQTQATTPRPLFLLSVVTQMKRRKEKGVQPKAYWMPLGQSSRNPKEFTNWNFSRQCFEATKRQIHWQSAGFILSLILFKIIFKWNIFIIYYWI